MGAGVVTAVWSGADADAIAAELARVILGGRGPERTEQRMDTTGDFARQIIAYRIYTADLRVQWLVWHRASLAVSTTAGSLASIRGSVA